MKDLFPICLCGFCSGVLLVLVLNFNNRTVSAIREEAVLRGCAKWVVDTKGKATFQWKEHKP